MNYYPGNRLNVWPVTTDAGKEPALLPIDTPADPFNLTDELEHGSQELDLSFYATFDDVAAVAEPTLDLLQDAPIEDDLQASNSDYLVNEDLAAAAPDDVFPALDLADEADESFDLSSYWQVDDDAAVAPGTLTENIDAQFDQSDETFDLSLYQQVDDDAIAAPDKLTENTGEQFDSALDDAFDASFYSTTDDDVGAAPDTLFGNFDFIEDSGLFETAESFYYQQDDDATVPPVPPPTGAGGVAGRTYVISSSERKHKPELERKRNREPFDVELAKPPADIAELSANLFKLGKQLGRNKQAVKDRLKAEQAAEDLVKWQAILRLITIYEIELYNQNARRLLVILAEDSA